MNRDDFDTRWKPVYRPPVWLIVAGAVLWAIGYFVLAVFLRITGHV